VICETPAVLLYKNSINILLLPLDIILTSIVLYLKLPLLLKDQNEKVNQLRGVELDWRGIAEQLSVQ